MQNDTVVCYHKDCCDGMGAALAAYLKYGNDVDYLPYVPNTDVEGLEKYEDIFFLDSVPKEELFERIKHRNLTILDHHSGNNKPPYSNYPGFHFNNNHSGAYIAWEYFQSNIKVPDMIRYIEDRDLWAWKLEFSDEISTYLMSVEKTFDSYLAVLRSWKTNFPYYLFKGFAMVEQRNSMLQFQLKAAYRVDLEGYNVPVLNTTCFISELGNVLAQKNPFAVLYYFDGKSKEYKLSFRSDENGVDVSEIAKKVGGGSGHARSSGCKVKILPWKM